MSFYLDASAILPTLLEEDASSAIDASTFLAAWRQSSSGRLLPPAEVASALSRLIRIGDLTFEDASARLADFDAWRAAATSDIDVHASDVRLANVFVRRFELMLRAPNAVHTAICARSGDHLVTLDRRLAHAARELGLTVVTPQ